MGIGLISDIKRIASMSSYAAIFRFNDMFNSDFEVLVFDTLNSESTARRFPAERNILLISGIRPMPIHELNQLRQLEIRKDFIKEAIQLCIECIGIERATRTMINRSLNALKEIFKERYDIGLIESKIEFLVEHGLIADSYYYIGKLVCNHLEKKDYAHQLDYQKLNSLALDLASDYENIKRSNLIKLYCKNLMKN